jgi:hypothetical protein
MCRPANRSPSESPGSPAFGSRPAELPAGQAASCSGVSGLPRADLRAVIGRGKVAELSGHPRQGSGQPQATLVVWLSRSYPMVVAPPAKVDGRRPLEPQRRERSRGRRHLGAPGARRRRPDPRSPPGASEGCLIASLGLNRWPQPRTANWPRRIGWTRRFELGHAGRGCAEGLYAQLYPRSTGLVWQDARTAWRAWLISVRLLACARSRVHPAAERIRGLPLLSAKRPCLDFRTVMALSG